MVFSCIYNFLFFFSGDHLKTCNNDGDTCCTESMENKLSVLSRQEFDKRLNDLIMPFSTLLAKKHNKFDGKSYFYNYFFYFSVYSC